MFSALAQLALTPPPPPQCSELYPYLPPLLTGVSIINNTSNRIQSVYINDDTQKGLQRSSAIVVNKGLGKLIIYLRIRIKL
jgi:hypothetical protein